jgi:cystathionine beta-lyase
VLFQADLYGGTLHLVSGELTRLGINATFARSMPEFESSLRPETRLVYVESPSNPLLKCVDLLAIGELARRRGILSAIDNTFASPINQNPLTLGIDIAVHSGTKYLNGHSDLNCGAVVSSRAILEKIMDCAMNLGGMLDSHACYQLERGMKTLALRIRQQNANAGHLAEFLQQHPRVSRVHYPGLPSHPDHAIAARQMRGFGGMLAIELADASLVPGVLGRFKLVTPALSLGGCETLICAPRDTSHRGLSPQERRALGITDSLLRVSVGIEDIEDLLADFDQALRS